jgi:hypothetical protein
VSGGARLHPFSEGFSLSDRQSLQKQAKDTLSWKNPLGFSFLQRNGFFPQEIKQKGRKGVQSGAVRNFLPAPDTR